MADSRHITGRMQIEDLSFVADRDGKQLPKYANGELPRCFWNVKASGQYGRDCRRGSELAIEYLSFEESNAGCPILNLIINDMPKPLTGVEVGFLVMVGFAAKAGADHARQVHAYQTSAAA